MKTTANYTFPVHEPRVTTSTRSKNLLKTNADNDASKCLQIPPFCVTPFERELPFYMYKSVSTSQNTDLDNTGFYTYFTDLYDTGSIHIFIYEHL